MPRFHVKVEAKYRSYSIELEREEVGDSAIQVTGQAVYDILDDAPSGAKVTSIEVKRLRPIGD